MNKFVLGLLAFTAPFATSAMAQESGRYARKAVRPSFFIPEKEFDKRERLPEFPAIESGLIKVTDEGIMVRVSDAYEDEDIPAAPAQPQQAQTLPTRKNAAQLKQMLQRQNISEPQQQYFQEDSLNEEPEPIVVAPPAPKAVYTPEDGLGDGLSRDENYLRKEKAYEEDLKAMATTGVMPENAELETDLKKMDSSVSFSVD